MDKIQLRYKIKALEKELEVQKTGYESRIRILEGQTHYLKSENERLEEMNSNLEEIIDHLNIETKVLFGMYKDMSKKKI